MERWYAWVSPFGFFERGAMVMVMWCDVWRVGVPVGMETSHKRLREFVLAFWSIDRTPMSLTVDRIAPYMKGNVNRAIGHGSTTKRWIRIRAHDFDNRQLQNDTFAAAAAVIFSFGFLSHLPISFVDVIGELNWAKWHKCLLAMQWIRWRFHDFYSVHCTYRRSFFESEISL